MAEEFLRLLVATEYSPNSSGGGGAIIRQMLEGWPTEKLFWWSCLPEIDKRFGLEVNKHTVVGIPSKLYPQRRWCRQKSWLMEHLWSPRATRHLEQTVKTLQPDVIWAIPHAWSIPSLARVLPQGTIGFHVSIHDYMDTDNFIRRFGLARCQRQAVFTERLYAVANTRDAIGQTMLNDLQSRTGVTGNITRAGLEAEDFTFLQNPPKIQAGPLRIAYAGSIQVEGVFPPFVKALQQVRRQFSRPLTLEFFGNTPYNQRSWFDPSWMRVHGNLPLTELSAALKQCDWGFSPMDLTDNDPRYNRFSLPTKFISYLAAGLPIITLGHPESSVIKMASSHEVGICLTTMEESELANQLLAAFAEPNPKIKFRSGLQRCAAVEFDAAKMRKTLHGHFQECANKTNQTEKTR